MRDRVRINVPLSNPTDSIVDRMPLLLDAFEKCFGATVLAGTWERSVSASLHTKGGRAVLMSVALVAREGDWQSALPIGEVRAETGTATLMSFPELVDAHVAGFKGNLDLERHGYETLALEIKRFFQLHGVQLDG